MSVHLMNVMFASYDISIIVLLATFPVCESGINLTTITFGHRSGKLLSTGSEDSTIHIYLIGQPTSLLVGLVVFLKDSSIFIVI